jgi:hypothetical protein
MSGRNGNDVLVKILRLLVHCQRSVFRSLRTVPPEAFPIKASGKPRTERGNQIVDSSDSGVR